MNSITLKELGCELIAAALHTIKSWSSTDYTSEQTHFLSQLFPSWSRLPAHLDLINALDVIFSPDLEAIIETYDLTLDPRRIRRDTVELYAQAYAQITQGHYSRHLVLPTPDDLRNWDKWTAEHKHLHVLFNAPTLFFAREPDPVEVVEVELPQAEQCKWTQGVLL